MGTVRLAFRKIGVLTPAALRMTTREVEAISVVGLSSVSRLHDASRTTMMSFKVGRSRWLFAGRAHDCTPLKACMFGFSPPSQCRIALSGRSDLQGFAWGFVEVSRHSHCLVGWTFKV